MMFTKTPIGYTEIPSWQEKEVKSLSDGDLIKRAIEENRRICVSPAVYAEIEVRNLSFSLQKAINPNVGLGHHHS